MVSSHLKYLDLSVGIILCVEQTVLLLCFNCVSNSASCVFVCHFWCEFYLQECVSSGTLPRSSFYAFQFSCFFSSINVYFSVEISRTRLLVLC